MADRRTVNPPSTTSRTATIQSITKAARVLKAFSKSHPDYSVTELSRHLGWHKAGVHKILATLELHRFVQQDSISRRYRLGPAVMELAGVFQSEEPLIREGQPLLKRLVRVSGHTAALAVLDGREVQYIATAEGTSDLRSIARVGDRRPAHATASGKALLCELSFDILEQLFGRELLTAETPHTITDLTRLTSHLTQVRTRGFALNMEERTAGMVGVAAPVRDHQEAIVAAISVGFARQGRGRDAVDEAVSHVVAAAGELSRRLGMPTKSAPQEPALPMLRGAR